MGRHAVQQRIKANPYSDEDEDALQSDSEQSERPLKQASKPRKDNKKKRPAQDEEEGEEDEPIAKRKRVSKPKSTSKTSPDEEENDEQTLEVKVNDEGEKYLDLGKKRRATVRTFKGTVFLDIREYYGQDGDEKPGKKGVTLSQDQWAKLKEGQDAIDTLFKKMKK